MRFATFIHGLGILKKSLIFQAKPDIGTLQSDSSILEIHNSRMEYMLCRFKKHNAVSQPLSLLVEWILKAVEGLTS